MFTNISPSSKVTPTIPPMPAISEDCTAFSGENASDAITTDRKASPAGMAQREEASAEKEAPTVGGLIREAMKVISEGKLGDGERISVERSELGTTVLIETLA